MVSVNYRAAETNSKLSHIQDLTFCYSLYEADWRCKVMWVRQHELPLLLYTVI